MDKDLLIELERLKNKYSAGRLTKIELAIELNVSLSTITRRLSTGRNIPNYQKGEGENGRVYFTILEVAKYLVKNNRTM